MRLIFTLLMLLAYVSCAQVRSVSQTSIPVKKENIVKAEVKNNIILFFNFSTTYVNDLTAQLQNACPNGKVEGILTKDVIVTYFPIIFYQEQISTEGYCVK